MTNLNAAPSPEALSVFLLDAMKRNGIPSEKLDVYKALVDFEWNMDKMNDYASVIDPTSPDRNNAVSAQNARLKEIREAMMTTEEGKKKLAQMKAGGHDDGTTVPFPPFSAFQSSTE